MNEDKAHLLIVDDDARLRSLLYKFLTDKGFYVATAENAAQATELIDLIEFDLAVVDVMMPGESGFQFTEKLRNSPDHQGLPILLLTAMGEVDNRIEGLSYGADDYLTKPFDPRELLLRITAILRRSLQESVEGALNLGDVSYIPQSNQLERFGESIALTTVESHLLRIFAKNLGKTLTRDDLAEVFNGETNPRTIDVQITRLRKKIEDNPKVPRYLQTVRGKGYVLIPA